MKNLSFCRAFFNSLRLPEFLIYNISLFYCLLAIERGPLSLDCNIYIFKIKRRRKSAFMRDSCSRRLEQDIWWVSVTGAAKTKLVFWVPCAPMYARINLKRSTDVLLTLQIARKKPIQSFNCVPCWICQAYHSKEVVTQFIIVVKLSSYKVFPKIYDFAYLLP